MAPGPTASLEGGALCGALLPVTVFFAVKVTGGAGLARRVELWCGYASGGRVSQGSGFDCVGEHRFDDMHDVLCCVGRHYLNG